MEIRTQPTGGHTQLVHFFFVIPQPCTRIVADDECHRTCNGVSDQVDDRGVVGQRGDHDIGRPGGGLPQRTDELGHRRRSIAAGADEAGQRRLEHATSFGPVGMEFDFDLRNRPTGPSSCATETVSSTTSARSWPLPIAYLDGTPHRGEACHRCKVVRPGGCQHQIRRRIRHTTGRSIEADLTTHEIRRRAVFGKLDGPWRP